MGRKLGERVGNLLGDKDGFFDGSGVGDREKKGAPVGKAAG